MVVTGTAEEYEGEKEKERRRESVYFHRDKWVKLKGHNFSLLLSRVKSVGSSAASRLFRWELWF